MGIHGVGTTRGSFDGDGDIVIAFYTTKALCTTQTRFALWLGLANVNHDSSGISYPAVHGHKLCPRWQIKRNELATPPRHVVLALHGPTPKLKIN
jgi:hypothetical protein